MSDVDEAVADLLSELFDPPSPVGEFDAQTADDLADRVLAGEFDGVAA